MKTRITMSVIAVLLLASFFPIPFWPIVSCAAWWTDAGIILILGLCLLSAVRALSGVPSASRPSRIAGAVTGTMALALLVAISVSIVLRLEPVTQPFRRLPRSTSAANACVNNLRMIDSGKEQWALAKGKSPGDSVVVSEVNQYIKGNRTPICPNGGTYSYNRIGEPPTCSLEPTEQKKIYVSLLVWKWLPAGRHHM